MSVDLEERVERHEDELGIDEGDDTDEGEEWPSPWEWEWSHREVLHDATGSGYDIGVDVDGDVVIHHDGYARCVDPEDILWVLNESVEIME